MIALLLALQDVDKTDLARAQIEQLAAGLKLHAEARGRYPDALEDGFRLSGDVPKDPWGRDFVYDGKSLKSLGPDAASALDDPEHRLPEIAPNPLDDRTIALELVRAFVLAHRRATRGFDNLTTSPYLVGKLPAEITLTASRDGVRITYTRPDKKPAIDPARAEALLRDLGADDVETRDRAAAALIDLGSLDALKGRDDPEIAARLKEIETAILARREFERATVRTSVFVFPAVPSIGGRIQANERDAIKSVEWLYLSQVNFKAKDIDANGKADYWLADLRGLSCMKTRATGRPAADITDPKLAAADGSAPAPKYSTDAVEYDASLVTKSPNIPTPNDGYIFFPIPLDAAGKPHAPEASFALGAVPADYGVTGTLTVITSHTGHLFTRDTRGRAPDRFPTEDELERLWKRVD